MKGQQFDEQKNKSKYSEIQQNVKVQVPFFEFAFVLTQPLLTTIIPNTPNGCGTAALVLQVGSIWAHS